MYLKADAGETKVEILLELQLSGAQINDEGVMELGRSYAVMKLREMGKEEIGTVRPNADRTIIQSIGKGRVAGSVEGTLKRKAHEKKRVTSRIALKEDPVVKKVVNVR